MWGRAARAASGARRAVRAGPATVRGGRAPPRLSLTGHAHSQCGWGAVDAARGLAASSGSRPTLPPGPGLSDFIRGSQPSVGDQDDTKPPIHPLVWEGSGAVSAAEALAGGGDGAAGAPRGPGAVKIETYGCQMNVADTEVVTSILASKGFTTADEVESADVVLLNTCAIRENAESKIWQRLGYFKNRKKAGKGPAVVGVLGCMAERLKERLLESDKLVDIVVGPDAYRDLPRLIDGVRGGLNGAGAMNVQLSLEETYADITPVRRDGPGSTSAFVSVMRGCNNVCTYCIVPFTRGRERSRPIASILDEVRLLSEQGVREVTLLGQNVNSFSDFSEAEGGAPRPGVGRRKGGEGDDPFKIYSAGFTSVYKPRRDGAVRTPPGRFLGLPCPMLPRRPLPPRVRFAELLHRVSEVDPEMRVRFTSPHPKDFPDELLQVMAERPNICNQIHMPAQSGSSSVLAAMRRGYTRESYLELVDHMRAAVPEVSLSSDFISGFCGETEADHRDTVSLIEAVGYDTAYLFAYSLREKTPAARHLEDDVPEPVKLRRLQECIGAFRGALARRIREEVGSLHLVLVDGTSKKSAEELVGRTCTNKKVVFPRAPVPAAYRGLRQGGGGEGGAGAAAAAMVDLRPGDYAAVYVQDATPKTLRGEALGRTGLVDFVAIHGGTRAVPGAGAEAAVEGGGAGVPAAEVGRRRVAAGMA